MATNVIFGPQAQADAASATENQLIAIDALAMSAETAHLRGRARTGVDALRLLYRLSSNPDTAEDALKLLHELQVHQVELDLQNESIAAHEQALVEELSLYQDFYDSAPLGYLLVDGGCVVVRCNPAAAELLARKAPSLWGEAGRAWPQGRSHRAEHAAQYAPLYAAREAWLARFAEYRRAAARELDPGQWRGARVLALAPHPDDELIGCGGTLCRLAAAGAELIILQATDGARLRSLRDLSQSRRKSVRLEEARRVAAALGADLVLWGQQDSRLRRCEAAVAALARALDEVRPTHVFTPFLGDPHADHRILSGILADALLLAAIEPCVLQYEVWSLVPANLYCDVTREAQRVERLLLLYARAMRADDFVHFCESRNLARAFELTGRPGYAEAFVSDARGALVCMSGRTSDYYQGDEAKWQKTFLVGPDAVFVEEVEMDESTQTFQSQVSMSIVDPATGEVIGAITVGVNIDAL